MTYRGRGKGRSKNSRDTYRDRRGRRYRDTQISPFVVLRQQRIRSLLLCSQYIESISFNVPCYVEIVNKEMRLLTKKKIIFHMIRNNKLNMF